MRTQRHIGKFIIILFIVVLTGTLGYYVLLPINLLDALYMTLITISTVGFGEVVVLTPLAKMFTIVLIVVSLGVFGYVLSQLVQIVMEGEISEAWRRRKMTQQMESYKGHYILCGAGETGQLIIEELLKSQQKVVVIEENHSLEEELRQYNVPYIIGDATDDEVLYRAGIQRAKGFVTTIANDADNVYLVITARQLNPDIYIVARAIELSAGEKLNRAGADKTVSLNEIGGYRMASILLRPSVVTFLDAVTHVGDLVLDMEDVVIGPESPLVNLTLREARIPEKTDLIIIAIRKRNEETMRYNPKSHEVLEIGDSMIVLGRDDQIDALRKIAHDDGKR